MFELTPYSTRRSVMDPFNFFNDFFGTNNAPMELRTDISDKGDTFVLEADLPGFKKDEITLELKDGYLTISAQKAVEKDNEKHGRMLRQERYAGMMQRSFYVGENVQPKDVHATFEDGILKLTLPKAAQQKLPENNTIAIE